MSFFGEKYVPEFSVDYDKLPWHERDFITYIYWLKYKEMKDNPDEYFFKKKVVNFDIIHHECWVNFLTKSYKELQTVVSQDLKKYSENDKDKTVLALFRNKRDDLWMQRELMIGHLKKKLSSY